jgi:hypothetical protein
LAVPEIRCAIFGHLDRRSLVAAGLVCRGWAASAVDLIWQELNADKLTSFASPPEPRRSRYSSAVRTLYIPKPSSLAAIGAWDFPRLRRLHCHDSIITQASLSKTLRGLLSRCGTPASTLLSEAVFSRDLSGVMGPPPDQEPLYSPFTERYMGAFGKFDGGVAKLHPTALQLLAEYDARARASSIGSGGGSGHKGSLSVLEIHQAVVTGVAVEQALASVPDAFAHVRRLSIVVQGADWARVLPFMRNRAVSDLELGIVATGDAASIIRDVSHHMRQLQRLAMGFTYPVSMASWTSVLALGQLSGLEELSLYGELLPIRLSADDWRRLLLQLPRLQRLAVGAECQLPGDAYVIAGECCRQLRLLEFDNLNDHRALVHRAPEPRVFPEMRTMTLSSFGEFDFSSE